MTSDKNVITFSVGEREGGRKEGGRGVESVLWKPCNNLGITINRYRLKTVSSNNNNAK